MTSPIGPQEAWKEVSMDTGKPVRSQVVTPRDSLSSAAVARDVLDDADFDSLASARISLSEQIRYGCANCFQSILRAGSHAIVNVCRGIYHGISSICHGIASLWR